MKAAPITKKPSFPLMKQGDIQNIYHLQMPRWLFTDPRYIGLSLEAKVTYTFLLNRFQLSRLNGWLNDDGEVFIIYTRRSLSSEMQVSYHKIIEAMKELSSAGLIWERRCGRGDANQIYLALVEHRETAGGSAPFVPPEHEAAGGEQPVPAGGSALETGPSGKGRTPPEPHEAQAPPASPRSAGSELLVPAQPEQRGTAAGLEVPGPNFLKSQSGTSRDSETELPEVDQRDSSYIDLNHTDGIHTEFSLSCPSGAGDRMDGLGPWWTCWRSEARPMEDAKRQTLARIVRAGAEEMLPRQLALLEQICAIDSGTGNEAGNAAVTGLLEPVLSELGARTERVTEPGLGTHLVARVRPEQPRGKVLLAAHLDTVFGPGFAEKHPFHIEGEWAHGLGAGDCKSGVLISLFGALILKKAGLLPPWELTYLFTCDEETGSRSGRKVYAREAQDAALALVFEGGRERDGRPRFVTSRRGVILGTVDVAGREAHAGKAYLEGRSAVLELAHQIIRLYSFNDYEKGIYYNVAPISGGRPNGVVAGEARGEFCVAGIPENADFPVIQARLDSMADQVTVEGCRVQVTYRTLFPAMERNAANHSAYLRAAEAAELLGWEPEEIADPAATDGAYLSTYGVPTVDALSAIAEQIHTTEERVRIPSIRDRTALCAAMLGLLG